MGLTFGALASFFGSVFTLGGTIGITGSVIGGALGGALSGALIGATIGGLGSLVMGGDIGKGMLYGAIGGAITGGISGFMETGSFLSAGTSQGFMETGMTQVALDNQIAVNSAKQLGTVPNLSAEAFTKTGVQALDKGAGGGFFSKVGDEVLGSAVEGLIGIGGQMLAGKGAEEKWKAEMDAQIAEAEKQRQHDMKKLKMQLAAGGGGGGGGAASERDWAAELAENRRQFDAELGQRKAEFASTMGMRKQELYAPMEYEKERKKRAGSALASVDVQRGQYKQAPTIKSQLQGANQYPDAVQEPLEATA